MRRKGKKDRRNIPRARLKRAAVSTGCLAFGLFLSISFPIRSVRAAGDGEPALPTGDMGLASLKMGAALLLVIVVILGLYYLSRKMRDGRFSLNKDPAMRLRGSLSIAPKRSIALVEVCGEWLVLGVGAETITLLQRLENPPTNNNETVSSGPVTGGNFQSLLLGKLQRFSGRKSGIEEKNGTPG